MAGVMATGRVDAQGFKGVNSSLFFTHQILPENSAFLILPEKRKTIKYNGSAANITNE
jgi:hypothetical protein